MSLYKINIPTNKNKEGQITHNNKQTNQTNRKYVWRHWGNKAARPKGLRPQKEGKHFMKGPRLSDTFPSRHFNWAENFSSLQSQKAGLPRQPSHVICRKVSLIFWAICSLKIFCQFLNCAQDAKNLSRNWYMRGSKLIREFSSPTWMRKQKLEFTAFQRK